MHIVNSIKKYKKTQNSDALKSYSKLKKKSSNIFLVCL